MSVDVIFDSLGKLSVLELNMFPGKNYNINAFFDSSALFYFIGTMTYQK